MDKFLVASAFGFVSLVTAANTAAADDRMMAVCQSNAQNGMKFCEYHFNGADGSPFTPNSSLYQGCREVVADQFYACVNRMGPTQDQVELR